MSAAPSSSSAARIAPTRPSIMSLGATMSAPARAWLTAVRASSSSVASLSTSGRRIGPGSKTPQWPWLVYSQRQTSAITSSSGCAARIARVASWTTPSVVPGAAALVVLLGGDAEQQHGGNPERGDLARPRRRPAASGSRAMPGIASIGCGASMPSSTNSGITRSPAVTRVSRTRSRRTGVRRSRRIRVTGKAIAQMVRRGSGPQAAQAQPRRDGVHGGRASRCSAGPESLAPSRALCSPSSAGLNGKQAEITRITS